MGHSEAAVVEVAYARSDRQRVIPLAFREGMTAADAVAESGVREEFPELATRPLVLGIFGRVVEAARPLAPGDRVEIYRPLPADPREARRRRAARGRGTGR